MCSQSEYIAIVRTGNQAPSPSQLERENKMQVNSQRYAPHFTITVLVKGHPPKRNGRNPYAVYRTGLTVGEFLAHPVAKAADLWWDEKQGTIRINREPPKRTRRRKAASA